MCAFLGLHMLSGFQAYMQAAAEHCLPHQAC